MTDATYHPRARSLFDQARRAAISVEANIVEGYALGTHPQFRRHLRIALGSAAEVEAMIRVAGEMGYLTMMATQEIEALTDGAIRTLFGLLKRSEPLPAPRSPKG